MFCAIKLVQPDGLCLVLWPPGRPRIAEHRGRLCAGLRADAGPVRTERLPHVAHQRVGDQY